MDWCGVHREQILVTGAIQGEIDLVQSSGFFPHCFPLGIGNLNASIQLMELVVERPALKLVVFLGSAGTYPTSGLDLFDVVSSDFITSIEFFSDPSKQKTFPLEPIQIPESPVRKRLEKTIRFVKSNAPQSLTLGSLSKIDLEIIGLPEIENLEVYGCAKVCQNRGLDFLPLLGITNKVGKEGSLDWQKNWRTVSNAVQERFLSFSAA